MDTIGGRIKALRRAISREDLQDLTVGAIVFALTYFLSQYYVAGDQVGYEGAYHAVRGVEPDLGFKVYRYFISTMEFIHYSVVYVASNLSIDKNLFFSFLNGLLSMAVFQIFRAKNVNIVVSLFFVFTNFYMYVLYFSAERLKIAIFIMLFGAFFVRSGPAKFLWLSAAVATHVTIILLFIGRAFRAIYTGLIAIRVSPRKKVIELSAILFVLAVLIYYYNDYIFWKFYQYYSVADNGLFSALPLAACVLMSLYYARDRQTVVFDYIPLVIAFALLGGSRVNMFAYIIFLRHGLPVNRGVNVGVLVTMSYFAYKSAEFVLEVISSGQGF